jgi:hypothetical protein
MSSDFWNWIKMSLDPAGKIIASRWKIKIDVRSDTSLELEQLFLKFRFWKLDYP